jgi:hypothetical protein
MSPQDDVNRSAKLATGFAPLQQNFTLDSAIAHANPTALQNGPVSGGTNGKRAPKEARFLSCGGDAE